jgi:hypothetical protein
MTWVFVAFSPLFTKVNKGINMDIGRLYKEHYNESHDAALGVVFSAGFDAGVASVAPQPDTATEQPAVPVGNGTAESAAGTGGQAPSVENPEGAELSAGGPDAGVGQINVINGSTNANYQSSVAAEQGATSGSGEAGTQEPSGGDTAIPEAKGVDGGSAPDSAPVDVITAGGGPEAAAAG